MLPEEFLAGWLGTRLDDLQRARASRDSAQRARVRELEQRLRLCDWLARINPTGDELERLLDQVQAGITLRADAPSTSIVREEAERMLAAWRATRGIEIAANGRQGRTSTAG